MTDQQPPNPQQNEGQPSSPSGAADSNPASGKQDNKNSQTAKQTSSNVQGKPPRTPIKDRKWFKRAYKIATDKATPNVISAVYTVATIVLLVATYFILRATRESVRTSNNAVTAALDANKISETTLVEARTEFEILNRPYLEIGNVEFSIVDSGKIVYAKLKYDVLNLGKIPAKVLWINYGALMRATDDTAVIDTCTRKGHMTPNVVLGNESEGGFPMNGTSAAIKDPFATNLKNQTMYYYVFGEIEYENAVSKWGYKYRFIYKLYKNGHIDILRNDDQNLGGRIN